MLNIKFSLSEKVIILVTALAEKYISLKVNCP